MFWVIKGSTGLLYCKLFSNYIKEPAIVQTVFQILGVYIVERRFPSLVFTYLLMTSCHNAQVDNTYFSIVCGI
jgi:hypothetical protein